MPDLRCNECGQIVRVLGLAATCPHCGNLVSVTQHGAPPPQITPRVPNPDEFVSLLPTDLPAVPPPPVAPEPVPAIPFSSRPHNPWHVVGIAVGTCLALIVLVDWIHVRFLKPAPTPTVVTAPAPAPLPRVNLEPPLVVTKPPPKPEPVEPTPPPATKPAEPVFPHAALAELRPIAPKTLTSRTITDAMIGDSIRRGVDYLMGQFSGSRLRDPDSTDAETFAGRDALCVYALLHAGQAINDERLKPQTDFINSLLERLKEFPMSGNRATYARSLRLSALGVYQRGLDRGIVEGDAKWLMNSSVRGGFTYSAVAEETRTSQSAWGGWDNSNSQYGALGLWAAADNLVRVPNMFWSEVEKHWLDSQTHSGAWGYSPGSQQGNLAMTAGGITSLLVARDQLNANASDFGPNADTPKALRRALEWLDERNNAVTLPGDHPGYTLYGLERAGLASGYKFFGNHDWYTELAAQVIKTQQKDGAWTGGDGDQVETAFTLLFLARGRHPLLVGKLQFEGNWANNPRDLASLTHFASQQLERPMNWQTVSLDRSWRDWADSPALYLATDKPPELTDSQVNELRNYIEAGGVLFTHADKDSAATTKFAEELARKMFPQYPYERLPESHPLFSAFYQLKNPPPLMGVSNGSRLLMIHCPVDVSRFWQRKMVKNKRDAFEVGMNVSIYSSGRREMRNRIESIVEPDPSEPAIGTVPIARVRHSGNWDPEPGAWRRFAQSFENETRIHVNVEPVSAVDLNIEKAPLAVLTGTDAIKLTEKDIDALRVFVVKGGVLFIDSAGGSKAFAASVRGSVFPKLLPGMTPTPVPAEHPILSGRIEGGEQPQMKLRTYSVQLLGATDPPPLLGMKLGQGQVIFSDLDVSSGLLGTATWGVNGYLPTTSEPLARNLLLWSMKLPPR